MGAERINRIEVTGQFRLGQGGMDFRVADVMQQNHWAALAALELGDQMMQRLRRIRRYRAQT